MGNPENPGRDPQFISFRLSTRENVGYGLTRENFDAIVRQQADYLVAQNVDGYFIEARDAYFASQSVEGAFNPDDDSECPPQRGHRYVQGCDPGISSDSTWSIVLDYTDRTRLRAVRARRRVGKQTIPSVVNIVLHNNR
jgi:hypothetical protein